MRTGVGNSQRFLLKVRQIQPTYGKARRVTDRYCQCPRLRISFLQGTRRRTWPLRAMYLRPIAPLTSALPAAKNCSAQSPKMAFLQTRTPCNVPTIGTLCATRSRPAHPSGKQVHQSAAYRRGAGRGPRSELPHPVDRLHSWHRFTELIQGPSAF